MKFILEYPLVELKEEYDTLEDLLNVMGNRIEDGSYEGMGYIKVYQE